MVLSKIRVLTALATVGLLILAGCAGDTQETAKTEEAPASEVVSEEADEAPQARKENPTLLDPKAEAINQTAPDLFQAKFVTSAGEFVIEAHRDWSPLGTDRFYNLVKNGFYNEIRFFRNVPNFMVQFGIHGDPKISTLWKAAAFDDEPVKQANTRGRVTFAKTGAPNSRTSQLFINFGENSYLDQHGFTPFGEIIEGMDVVDKLYDGYGECAPKGSGPDQGRIYAEGNEYLQASFPSLDYVVEATIVE